MALRISGRGATSKAAYNRPARRKRPLVHLAARIFEVPLCIMPSKMESILAVVGPRLLGAELPVDDWDREDDDDFAIQDGVGVIPLMGTLVRRASGMSAASGMTSYEQVTRQFNAAVQDPAVKAIVLDVDSPGGEVSAMLELSDLIYSQRGQKPILAVANDVMCSAAFCVASAADRILVSRTSEVGSVGCFMLHVDQSGSDKAEGLRYTYVFAGAQKTEGNPHEPLAKSAETTMQAEVNRIRGLFAQTVARNRNVSVQSILATEAGVRFGPACIPLFGDALGTCDDAIAALGALPAPTVVSLPASPTAVPTSASRRLPASAVADVDWLRSNLTIGPAHAALAERLRAEEPALRNHYGQAIEARLIQFPTARASVGPISSNRKISMLVAPTDGTSIDLGGFVERYQNGCWSSGLDGDVRALFSHDEQCVLGRKAAGTMRCWEAADGLRAEADPPECEWADALLTSMRRGDITGASAAFWILQARWEQVNGRRVRVVEKALLRDCSVVAIPAYQTTSASVVPALPGASGAALDAVWARMGGLRALPASEYEQNWLKLARVAGIDPSTELGALQFRLFKLRHGSHS